MNNPSHPVTSATDTSSTQSSQAAAQGTKGAPGGDFNASTPVANIADLQSKAPTVFKAMMEGIAMNIVNEMKDHQQRLKELQRQAQRDAEGKS